MAPGRQGSRCEDSGNAAGPQCLAQIGRYVSVCHTQNSGAIARIPYVQNTLALMGQKQPQRFSGFYHLPGKPLRYFLVQIAGRGLQRIDCGFQCLALRGAGRECDRLFFGAVFITVPVSLQHSKKALKTVPQSLCGAGHTLLLQRIAKRFKRFQRAFPAHHLAGRFGQLVGFIYHKRTIRLQQPRAALYAVIGVGQQIVMVADLDTDLIL